MMQRQPEFDNEGQKRNKWVRDIIEDLQAPISPEEREKFRTELERLEKARAEIPPDPEIQAAQNRIKQSIEEQKRRLWQLLE